MSRLIDELNRISRVTAQPMGFRTARSASSAPKILLIASLTQGGDTSHLAESVDGADAVLFRPAKSASPARALQKIAESLPDMPWGGWVEDISTKKTGTLVEAGCDFMVFPAASRVSVTPQGDKVGRILQIEPSLDDGLLRAINDLPVDAVLAAGAYEADGSIAWHQLMQIQRLDNLVAKPLLVSVSLNLTPGELKALWEAGVDGMVVEAGAGQPAARLREMRQLISELPPRSAHKRGRAEAMLPRVGGETGKVAEDEEEEGEDE